MVTKESFLEDVKNHSIEVKKNEGVYRHLVCSNNGHFNQKFEIVTFPNHLVYTGDMGTFVFSRVADMFTFFRSENLEINPGYWSEKVLAESVYGNGIKDFSVERFHERVLDHTRLYLDLVDEDGMADDTQPIPAGVMDDIEELLGCSDEWECVETMRNFRSDVVEFTDFFEGSLDEYTPYFIWTCYAIVWAIQNYMNLNTIN